MIGGRSGVQGRNHRDLTLLRRRGSSARALNLADIFLKSGHQPDYQASPLFLTPILNRSIIVKHQLRSNEIEMFDDVRHAATKVILPIDLENLRFGGRYFFVDQINFSQALEDLCADKANLSRDLALLQCLNRLPSLDPFLLRERLKQQGFSAARCYFDISEPDLQRIFDFVRMEISPLIRLSFGPDVGVADEQVGRFAHKILANDGDADLEPFRLAMGLDRAGFEEGLFCWKGFIYYKWSLEQVMPSLRSVLPELATILPTGATSESDKAIIAAYRARLTRAISAACETVRLTLGVYDEAYLDLTRNGEPAAFRAFLLRAPELFHELGERLSGVQHLNSFWRFRFPKGRPRAISAEELLDLLIDFETSLGAHRS
jgi:hypothetical protein